MSNGIDTIYRPGVAVLSRASAPPVGAPTDTTVGFIIGEATSGPVDTAAQIQSLDQFETVYGPRLATSYLYDGVEAFFREGGSRLYVARLDEGAVAASAALTGLGTGAKVNAAGPGTYADGWQLKVAASVGTFSAQTQSAGAEGDDGEESTSKSSEGDEPPERLTFGTFAAGDPFTAQLLDADGKVLQQSLQLYTSGDLAAWATSQAYITLTGVNPGVDLAALTATLAGGNDGTVPVTDDAALDTALALFGAELGPGQVWAPGKTDPDMLAAIMVHGQQNNRTYLLDAPRGADVPTLTATAGVLRGSDQDRYGGLFAPWATVPGVARGTTRTIPWSSIQAGMCARLDAQVGHANRAAAGDFGQSYFAIGLDQTFSDPDRQSLLYAGCNTARLRYGTVRGYGFRTLAAQDGPNGEWWQLNWARLNMQIVAECEAIGEEYVFSQIDGRGLTIAAFNGELKGMLNDLFTDGALYGDVPDDAFVVNTGSTVNTDQTIADGELHAVLSVKMSPHAELVEIEIVKVALTEALS